MTRFFEPCQHTYIDTYIVEAREEFTMWPKTVRYRDLSRKERLAEDARKHQAELHRISMRSRKK